MHDWGCMKISKYKSIFNLPSTIAGKYIDKPTFKSSSSVVMLLLKGARALLTRNEGTYSDGENGINSSDTTQGVYIHMKE